jgi:hypothetical protein
MNIHDVPPDAGSSDQDTGVDRPSEPDTHAYPRDLAHLVHQRWTEARTLGRIHPLLPDTSSLEHLLSICYQATLLREEGRPVTFRLALSDPEAFDAAAGPPTGLHRLVFTRPLPLDQHELRRLAVLMTDYLEIVGFGVEIAGELPEVPRVARAHDLDGTERDWVRTDRVGTRHRSAYRFCQAVHDALAVVVSQDGGLRFIRWHKDSVTYWEQIATGPGEV